jgi:transitional endoplasmic reticulum ATPase
MRAAALQAVLVASLTGPAWHHPRGAGLKLLMGRNLMNWCNTPGLFVARWVGVGLFFLVIVGSLAGRVHMDTGRCSELLALTLIASAAVWAQSPVNPQWTQAAFLVLSIGMLRLAFTSTGVGRDGLAIWTVSGALVLLQVIWRKNVRVGRRSGRDEGTTPPMAHHETGQADYSSTFEGSVRRARFGFAELIGMTETKARLLAASASIVRGNGSSRNGILLFGEPGNGKTLFAEALAGELKVPFMSIGYGEVASKWINETPQKIDAMFRAARRVGACVLFIDEFDSWVKPREGSDAGGHGHAMDRDMANVMLTNINALHGTRVLLVAATNFIEALDAAAIREGRFDYRIEIPPPDFEARVAILRKSIGKALGFSCVDPAVIASLAERWAGFSASRLAGLGDQLAEMRRDGQLRAGQVSFDSAMQAMRLIQGRKGRLPDDVKQIDEIVMPAGSRDALHNLAFRMRRVHTLEKMGGKLPTGAVFFGAQGTGKTQGALALAKEADWAFLKTAGPELLRHPDGWSRVVREAKDIRPVIVFIDEAEDVLRDRRRSPNGTLTNEILATIDGAGGRNSNRDILYVAATNHYDQLDSAALRGGRFEEKIHFDVPDGQAMREYLARRLKEATESRYILLPGVHECFMTVLDGRSIADADAVLARAISIAAVRAMKGHVAQLRVEDVWNAACGVLGEHLDYGVRGFRR